MQRQLGRGAQSTEPDAATVDAAADAAAHDDDIFDIWYQGDHPCKKSES